MVFENRPASFSSGNRSAARLRVHALLRDDRGYLACLGYRLPYPASTVAALGYGPSLCRRRIVQCPLNSRLCDR